MPQYKSICIFSLLLGAAAIAAGCQKEDQEIRPFDPTSGLAAHNARAARAAAAARVDSPAARVLPIFVAHVDTTVITPDSLLPAPSFRGVPGWLTGGMRDLRAWPGMSMDSTVVISRRAAGWGMSIFPPDTAWKDVGGGTRLLYINAIGKSVTVNPDGALMILDEERAGILRVRIGTDVFGAGWLIPSGLAATSSFIPAHDSVFPNGNTRIWTAGQYRIRMQRTGRFTADIFAEDGMNSVKREIGPQISAVADSVEGVPTDSMLSLTAEGRVPGFDGGAIRLGATGPVVWIFTDEDYNCSYIHVVVFRPSEIQWIENTFAGDCQR